MSLNDSIKLTDEFSDRDFHWMKVALNYASQGIGFTGKNPSVGCVIVKDETLISVSRTSDNGRPHAEEVAIREAVENVYGATLYVTLEPCAHYRDTSPCIEKIVSASIKRVVIGTLDPDPRTNGQGIMFLRENGIIVSVGCLKDKAENVIAGFKSRITKKRPFITVKIASSLDSKIALSNGISKWITNKHTRRLVHLYRARNDAILTGIGTINKDNPSLDCRILGLEKFSPKIIILDSKLIINKKSKLLNSDVSPIILTTKDCDLKNKKSLEKKNISVNILNSDDQKRVNIFSALRYLSSLNINNLLIEAGANIITSFIKNGFVDSIILCRSGHFFGSDGIPYLLNMNLSEIKDKKDFVLKNSIYVKGDIIEHWDVVKS